MFEAGPNQNVALLSTQMNATSSQSERTTQLSPQEEALQSLCKQLLRARLFRGYYLERRRVQPLESYRDVISLHRTERELEKLLLDVSRRLQLFYSHTVPDMWIGVTQGAMIGTELPVGALETYIWVELDELAFGQYWFSIKSIRFRQKEIIIKLKVVREVEDEVPSFTPMRQRKRLSAAQVVEAPITLATKENSALRESSPAQTSATTTEKQIDFEDFIEIVRQWGTSIKHTAYEFMSQDINKENIKGVLRFLGLLIFSIISAAVAGIKFLGVFTIRFMYEFSRLTRVMTPIILKIIDVLNKIVGGFYILIAMVWRDTVGKRANVAPPPGRRDFREVEYDRPLYRAIKYDIQESHRRKVQ